MLNLVKTFLRDEDGASALEYILIVAVMGTAILTIFDPSDPNSFVGALDSELDSIVTDISTP